MHPADMFEAFQGLLATGKSTAEIAARFGIAESVVSQRLALARVSPTLLQQYRDGDLNLDILQAFTLTDDHAAQEEVWSTLQLWDRNARAVRQLLSRDAIAATDKRVRFVGLAVYESEGGLVRRDLFADEDRGVYILDPVTLTRLVNAKLNALAEQTKAEGWKWVEIEPDQNSQAVTRLRRIPGEPAPLPAKDEKKLQKLNDKLANLQAQLTEDEEDEANEPVYHQMEGVSSQIDALHATRKPVFPDLVKANSGAIVSIDHNGAPVIAYGLLRKEDEKQIARETSNVEGLSTPTTSSHVPEEEEQASAYSAPLIESLTQQKTAAIAVELSRKPLTALAAVVHSLVLSEFSLDLHLYHSQTCVQISATIPYLNTVKTAPAAIALQQQRKDWIARLPKSSLELWQWCLTQHEDTLLRLLAFLTAQTVNAVRGKGEGNQSYRLQQADALATALEMDMTQWFTPTVENFFSRISKTRMTEAMAGAGKAVSQDVAKLKKAEFATLAEKAVAGTGWLPEPVRISAVQSDELGYSSDEEGEDASEFSEKDDGTANEE